jgi:RNA polymerase sigma-70 factor (ECF subfamily)
MLSEESKLLTDALADIPFEQREAIILRLQGGMKFRQIATAQGVSVSTVQGRYHYGLDKLRSMMNGEVKK